MNRSFGCLAALSLVGLVLMFLLAKAPDMGSDGMIRTDRDGTIITERFEPLAPVDGMSPGLWSIRRTIRIIDMPGATPNELSQAQQRTADPSTRTICYTAKKPMDLLDEAAGSNDRCRSSDFSASGGRISGELICQPSLKEAASPAGSLGGRYDSDGFEATLDIDGNLSRYGPAKLRITVDGRQISANCDGADGDDRRSPDLPDLP